MLEDGVGLHVVAPRVFFPDFKVECFRMGGVVNDISQLEQANG
jgi:hypothetical protein